MIMIYILWIIAIICIYKAVDHAVEDIYEYKYARNIARTFRDKNTRESFVKLKPYIDKYLMILRRDSNNYARNAEHYSEYINFLKKIDSDRLK